MHNADKLVRSTARIEAFIGDTLVGTGSGLLLALYPFGPDDPRFTAVAITNKHVVEGAESVRFFTGRSKRGVSWANVTPAEKILKHPEHDVDLCAIPIHPLAIRRAGDKVTLISSKDIWTQAKLEELSAIENIKMVGYPNGLIDTEDLFPIVRTGITATPAKARYCGRAEFLIDCACFPGSSGSPVFLLDQGIYAANGQTVLGGTRFGLLGFLYAGPVLTNEGKIVSEAGDTAPTPRVLVDGMLNLGYCVRAEKVLDFSEMVLSTSYVDLT